MPFSHGHLVRRKCCPQLRRTQVCLKYTLIPPPLAVMLVRVRNPQAADLLDTPVCEQA